MMTLRQLAAEPPSIPTRTSWYLADLAEARGKQELFTRQSPQKLKVLREHALVESAVSSNRIEGVEVDKSRVTTLIFGRPALRDRDEEEVRGYRDALELIHEQGQNSPSPKPSSNVCTSFVGAKSGMRAFTRKRTWTSYRPTPMAAAVYRFKTVPAQQTPKAMAEMVGLWNRGVREKWVHPLVLAAALNLDFLCIHPFRDGNGRVSRLLFLLACYHCGIEAGRYVSLERIIEDNKVRY